MGKKLDEPACKRGRVTVPGIGKILSRCKSQQEKGNRQMILWIGNVKDKYQWLLPNEYLPSHNTTTLPSTETFRVSYVAKDSGWQTYHPPVQ